MGLKVTQLLQILGRLMILPLSSVTAYKNGLLLEYKSTLIKYWLHFWDIPHLNWHIQSRVICENVPSLDDNCILGLQLFASENTFCFVFVKHLA